MVKSRTNGFAGPATKAMPAPTAKGFTPMSQPWVTCCLGLATLAASSAETATTFSVLLDFGSGTPQQPYPPNPVGVPLVDATGNIYGVTQHGGRNDTGTVFTLSPTGQFTKLYVFPYELNNPVSGVTANAQGNLIGTTQGYVFTSGSAYTIGPNHLARSIILQSNNGGPFAPQSPFIIDRHGNMITTSYYGGSNGAGTIFKISPDGQLTYFSLPSEDQRVAAGRLTPDSHGSLYGASDYTNDLGGALFRLKPDGTFSNIYNFSSFNGCSNPTAGFIISAKGNLYGTTSGSAPFGGGCIFRLRANGVFKILYQFPSTNNYASGLTPNGDLVADAAGNLYGTTQAGGAYGYGTVFEFSANGQLSVLHSFSGTDGARPTDGVTLAPDGNLYGVTTYGGMNYGTPKNQGILYKIGLSH